MAVHCCAVATQWIATSACGLLAMTDAGRYDPTPTVVRCLRDCVHGSDRADLVIFLHPSDLALVLDRLSHHPELRERLAETRGDE